MNNIFEPVLLDDQLVARNVATQEIAPEGLIRLIQLQNAYRLGQLLIVNATGRVSRVVKGSAQQTIEEMQKPSYADVVQQRDPSIMFDNLEQLTRMVGKGIQPSLMVTGLPGTGKTHLVKETLRSMGLRESHEFVHFKGRATAAGLVITLYENSDKLILLDDCDSVFKDDDAVNILKAALDSYDVRKISYISSKPLRDEFGNPIPAHFEFIGRIIFISNISQHKLDPAIRSRSFVADISMTTTQMFERMHQLAATIEPCIPMEFKLQALDIMQQLHAEYRGVSVNLRSFIKAARICAMQYADPVAMVAEQIIAPE